MQKTKILAVAPYEGMADAISTIAQTRDDIKMTVQIGDLNTGKQIAEILFGHCNVDGFFLEYDSERSGDFSPLRYIKDQKVVLGLITSKFPELEDKEDVKKRIEEAEKYVAKDQLCLSPQCGFSSTEEGNIMTEAEQWRKVSFVKEVAEEVWDV